MYNENLEMITSCASFNVSLSADRQIKLENGFLDIVESNTESDIPLTKQQRPKQS